jgi:hypothetical protein
VEEDLAADFKLQQFLYLQYTVVTKRALEASADNSGEGARVVMKFRDSKILRNFVYIQRNFVTISRHMKKFRNSLRNFAELSFREILKCL